MECRVHNALRRGSTRLNLDVPAGNLVIDPAGPERFEPSKPGNVMLDYRRALSSTVAFADADAISPGVPGTMLVAACLDDCL